MNNIAQATTTNKDLLKAFLNIPKQELLMISIKYGDETLGEYALAGGTPISSLDTLFQMAVLKNQLKNAKALYERGVSTSLAYWHNLLYQYFLRKHPATNADLPMHYDMLEFILKNGTYTNVNGVKYLSDRVDGLRVISEHLAFTGDTKATKILADNGFGFYKQTLIQACKQQQLGLCQFLIEIGVNASMPEWCNNTSDWGRKCCNTPLLNIVESWEATAETVTFLLNHGASVNDDGESGARLIHAAVKMGHEETALEVVKALREVGGAVLNKKHLDQARQKNLKLLVEYFVSQLTSIVPATLTVEWNDGSVMILPCEMDLETKEVSGIIGAHRKNLNHEESMKREYVTVALAGCGEKTEISDFWYEVSDATIKQVL
jgi:hypothetical protein